MNREYVENLINDLKAIEFGKDYIINGNELCELKKYLIDIHSKLDQLTNNWNELRQHIIEYLKEWENSDDERVKGKCDMASDILYDMKEIKEKYK